MSIKSAFINDSQALVAAKCRGYDVSIWDDGFGPLWVHRSSFGVDGIVRAQSWAEGEECFYNELAPDGEEPETPEQIEDSSWNEFNGFRGGMPVDTKLKSNIYAKDVNYDAFDFLTPQLAKELELEIFVENQD